MAYSARVFKLSVFSLAAKYSKVPTRIWLSAILVRIPPGVAVSLNTFSPVVTAASERVEAMPKACMASLTIYSRMTGPKGDLPSPCLENLVWPDPFN